MGLATATIISRWKDYEWIKENKMYIVDSAADVRIVEVDPGEFIEVEPDAWKMSSGFEPWDIQSLRRC